MWAGTVMMEVREAMNQDFPVAGAVEFIEKYPGHAFESAAFAIAHLLELEEGVPELVISQAKSILIAAKEAAY